MLGNVRVNGNGLATFTAAGLALGVHALSAVFTGNGFVPCSAALSVSVYGSTNPSAFAATPDPILIGQASTGDGATRLSWYAPSVDTVEIHVGSPDGPLFAEGGFSGFAITSDWVTDGMMFYLQDTSGGKPATSANTIAVLAVRVNRQSSAPAKSDCRTAGAVSRRNDHRVERTFRRDEYGDSSRLTRWAALRGWRCKRRCADLELGEQRMFFFLQDTSNGKALVEGNTLSSLQVGVASVPPPFLATPNPVPSTSVVNGQMAGVTTLTWNTEGSVQIRLGSPGGPFLRRFPLGIPHSGEPTVHPSTFGVT